MKERRRSRWVTAVIAAMAAGALIGCISGGFDMSYNMSEDRRHLTPEDAAGGYRYNIADGTWERVPEPPTEKDIEIRFEDDGNREEPDNGSR